MDKLSRDRSRFHLTRAQAHLANDDAGRALRHLRRCAFGHAAGVRRTYARSRHGRDTAARRRPATHAKLQLLKEQTAMLGNAPQNEATRELFGGRAVGAGSNA